MREVAAAFKGLLLVDEAYADFASFTCAGLVTEFPNVVIARSLSKAYSVAGLRFGYAIAQPAVINEMMKVKDSYNCDAISIAAATAAIQDQDYAQMTWRHVRSERERVSAELSQLGFSVTPIHANFIFARMPGGRGEPLYLALKQQGILVRYFDKSNMMDKLRITIGTVQERRTTRSRESRAAGCRKVCLTNSKFTMIDAHMHSCTKHRPRRPKPEESPCPRERLLESVKRWLGLISS